MLQFMSPEPAILPVWANAPVASMAAKAAIAKCLFMSFSSTTLEKNRLRTPAHFALSWLSGKAAPSPQRKIRGVKQP
ncbi:hypothetical protein AGRO_5463 [Agrobacterium sp. ATCC 31749]|nr:hypothetical protein AGRO_5463 [Agrobacterium sp. ATCC 31749]